MQETFARWFFVLWGGAVTAYAVPTLWYGWRALRWPAAAGRILTADVRHRRGRRGGYLPEVAYEYVVGDQTATGSRLTFGGRTLLSERGARTALRGAEPGVEVTVYYDPRQPHRSVLLPGVTVMDVGWLIVGLIVLAAGVFRWGPFV